MGQTASAGSDPPTSGLAATNRVPGRFECVWGSVEAYWPPLTPEHGFPSLRWWTRAQGAPPLPAPGLAGASAVLHFLSEKSDFARPLRVPPPPGRRAAKRGRAKTGAAPMGSPVLLPHDFLRWHYPHQVKGSRRSASSQPAAASSPVFGWLYYGAFAGGCQGVPRGFSHRQRPLSPPGYLQSPRNPLY